MSVSESIGARLGTSEAERSVARLPTRLKLDRSAVHVLVLQRLAASQLMTQGASAGVLRSRATSGFRVDVRQRVIVKALVARHSGAGGKGALARHVSYLSRPGAGRDGERGVFFDAAQERVDAQPVTREWAGDRHHFRFIISPEHGDRLPDMKAYVREVMSRVAADLKEPRLEWLGMAHFDTDQPHAHVLVRGKREDGRDLVIPRTYMGYGFRARATEVVQELLGDLSRDEGERRVWRETVADRFTRFDRSLIQEAAPAGGPINGGAGRSGTYPALLRGRLAHLEALGLATWTRQGFILHPELELKLRGLQISGDVIRTLNQRRLEGVREVRELGSQPVRGRVVRAGHHDELGAQGYVVVQDVSGREYYARLRLGAPVPEVGRDFTVVMEAKGVAKVIERASSRQL